MADRIDALRTGIAVHLLLAAVAYLPLLVTRPGRLASDTRQAIYLDPGRFVVDALSMWDPNRDLGTVTHQNIVLVWPMGLYFRATELVGMPLWVAQRLWLGSILFVAGAGVLHLARSLRWRGIGPVVAAFVYAFGPYVLQYGSRTSVLLLPWAALPWLLSFTQRALASGGWRHPALVALVATSAAVNATALALALLGPALWIAWSVWGDRTVALGRAARTAARMAVVGVATSLWWFVALVIHSRYGMPILEFTETIEQVALTSTATEVLRGLGYWVPYLDVTGQDVPEVSAAGPYLESVVVLALQLGLVAAAFVAAAVVRWRDRARFVLLLVVGLLIGVGAYPPGQGSPVGEAFRSLSQPGGLGLVLRSTTRASPLALLALACLLGAGVDAVVRRAHRAGVVVGAAVVVLAVVLAPTVLTRDLVDPHYDRADELPAYWEQALAAVDAAAGDGRMIEIPGTRFAAYRWGNTYEPITAGKAATPTAWREQIPYGGPGSADVLVALDDRIQEDRLDPRALAPVARLLGASHLVVRNDLAYERYDVVAPDRVWSLVADPPPGLEPPIGFGPVGVNVPTGAVGPDTPRPADPDATYPAVGVVAVDDAPGLVQVAPVSSTVVLDGDGDGLVDAAAAGVIDGRVPLLYAATTAGDVALLESVLDAGPVPIVLTDTNRRRVRRWRSVGHTTGITLRADQDPAADSGRDGGEAVLEVFPDADVRWQTVATPRVATVSATRYGDRLRFEPGTQPNAVLDGDPVTGWEVDLESGGVGDRVTVDLHEPLTTDHLTLWTLDLDWWVTEVDLVLDGGPPLRVTVGPEARVGDGQLVTFPARTFSRLELVLAGVAPAEVGRRPSSAGIAEIELTRPDGTPVLVDPVVSLPTALVDRLGERSLAHPLTVLLTRLRGDATSPELFREEARILRSFTVPAGRVFTLAGSVRSDAAAGGGCRTDLVAVDGVPVAVRVLAPTEGDQVVAGVRSLPVVGCEPVELATGDHELRTLPGPGDPIQVDQVVLRSAAGGEAAVLGADGRWPAPPSGEDGAAPGGDGGVDWRWDGPDRIEIDETGAAIGPRWIVVGQSRNDGWRAEVAGRDLGPPVLVNGYANGFLVPAGVSGSAAVRWEPSRLMDLALAVTAVAVLAALVLAVRGRRWVAGPVAGSAPSFDAVWAPRAPVPWPATLAVAAVGAVVAGAFIAPVFAPVVAATAVGGARWRRGRLLVLGSAVGLAVGTLLAVVVARIDRRDEVAFDFFTSLHTANRLALLAVVVLALDVVSERHRRPEEEGAPGPARARAWRALTAPAAGPDRRSGPVEGLRRYVVACVVAGVAATVLFGWMVTAGTGDLTQSATTAGFYDAQARSLMDGRLDVDPEVLGIEGFVSGGKTYMYQGPFPALLRVPVLALTDRFDGRLSAVSMLGAFAVAVAAVSWLTWQIRRLVLGTRAVTRWHAALAGGFVAAATAGSVLVFQATFVSVYHEAAIWGAAMALVTLGALVAHLESRSRGTVVAVGAALTATVLTRASIGAGMAVAVGLVALGHAWRWWAEHRSGTGPGLGAVVALALAAVLPVVAYCGLNVAKFGTLVSVPWEDQVYSSISENRQAFLAENDSFFGLRYVPMTALTYLRPDGFSLDSRFPWIGFRSELIGTRTGSLGVLFDKIDATASAPVTFPLLVPLAAVGLVAVLRSWRGRSPLAVLAAPLAGAAASAATIFVFGFIAQRYLADVVPLLVLAGAAGLWWLVPWSERRSGATGRVLGGVFVGLAALSVAVSVALGLWYQRVYVPPGFETDTAAFYEWRSALPTLPVGSTPTVGRGDELPTWAPAGELFVVGDCAGLYVSDGRAIDSFDPTSWKPVTRTPAVGAFDLRVALGELPRGGSEPLLIGPDDAVVVWADRLDDGRIRFRSGADAGAPIAVDERRTQSVSVAADPWLQVTTVAVEGRTVFWSFHPRGLLPRLADGLVARAELVPASDELCQSALRDGV